jgi:AmmeMemoRadiSam system protein B
MKVRPAAVAGTFYPGRADALEVAVDQHLAATPVAEPPRRPKALVVPHAGYIYSGPIAASAYAIVASVSPAYERVVLLGPAHYVPLSGLAVSSADAFATPLGLVRVDDELRRIALAQPNVVVDDHAHAPEHSLEVQLPFIQRVLGDVPVLPIVVGRSVPDDVAAVLDALWGGPESLVLVSTDLSHYLDYASAQVKDRRTADAVLARAPDAIANDDACGSYSLRGLLVAARSHGLAVELLDLRSSGDTAGDRARVVGYGAFALEAA